MIDPDVLRGLQATSNEQLRQIIAYSAGIHAHRDGDGGLAMADALERIAARLRGQPRKAA
jgi:hypothetical protein